METASPSKFYIQSSTHLLKLESSRLLMQLSSFISWVQCDYVYNFQIRHSVYDYEKTSLHLIKRCITLFPTFLEIWINQEWTSDKIYNFFLGGLPQLTIGYIQFPRKNYVCISWAISACWQFLVFFLKPLAGPHMAYFWP